MNDVPWTPGPWRVDEYARSGAPGSAWEDRPYSHFHINSDDDTVLTGNAHNAVATHEDAALIALAPEMAEAILFCDTLPVIPNVLKPIIAKLNAIGGGS